MSENCVHSSASRGLGGRSRLARTISGAPFV